MGSAEEDEEHNLIYPCKCKGSSNMFKIVSERKLQVKMNIILSVVNYVIMNEIK